MLSWVLITRRLLEAKQPFLALLEGKWLSLLASRRTKVWTAIPDETENQPGIVPAAGRRCYGKSLWAEHGQSEPSLEQHLTPASSITSALGANSGWFICIYVSLAQWVPSCFSCCEKQWLAVTRLSSLSGLRYIAKRPIYPDVLCVLRLDELSAFSELCGLLHTDYLSTKDFFFFNKSSM